MDIAMKYAYLEANQADGTRVLVDLLWSRDVSKEGARIDLWPKEITPSTEQHKWYYQNPEQNWDAFQQHYTAELAQQHAAYRHYLNWQSNRK